MYSLTCSTLLVCCGLFTSASSLCAQAATMVRGAHSSFMVGAPDGWMLDNRLAQQFNVPVAISAKDPSAFPGVLIYVASVPKSPQCRSLADYLGIYQSQIERPGTKLMVTHQRDLRGALGATAQVYYYSGLASQRLEANAYFENKDSIDMIVISTPNQEMFTKAFPVFNAVVGTYGNTALKPKEEPAEPGLPPPPPADKRQPSQRPQNG